MEQLRIGIVGCGRVVQTVHLAALASLPGIEVTALCDADAEILDRVAGRLGLAARFAAFEDLTSCPDVDAVLVARTSRVEVQVRWSVRVLAPQCADAGDALPEPGHRRDG